MPDSTSEVKSNEINYFVHSIIKPCQITEDRVQQIITETEKDDVLQSEVLQIQNG